MNTVNLAASPITGIRESLMRGQQNARTATAQGAADTRFNMKKLDRKGLSRSRGSKAQAEITGAQAAASQLADSDAQQLQNSVYNADAALRDQAQREQYAQQLWGMQSNAYNADALAAIQRQNMLLNFAGGALGGLLR